jgi:hypothetical protein
MARWKAGRHLRRPNLKATVSKAKAKGNYQARVHSDQMDIMAVRQKAGPVAWGPKRL